MRKTIVSILLLLLVFSSAGVFAADYYDKGNTFFTVKAGVTVPGFAKFLNNSEYGTKSLPDKMHTKIGGYGSLSYQVFTNSKVAVGGELGYGFNYTQSDKILTTVPMTAKFSFIPVQTGKFDLAINSTVGLTYNRYNDTKFMMPYASVTCCPSIYIGESWGLGLDAGMWFNAELHSKSNLKNDNAIVGFLPITFALTYRK